ncbi:prolipoprotein diacylglyceryl transferase [Gloeothece verrucosa]|uniref:Prolipoprotein diacylglyceryl transferase n=1 Tax=Gloeothece verrucosa (strain PCC 7822) TaxID=497965 RepID=E0U9Y6_GLOV7|nr:prolipoprotein diacylglyceryl transferase family protein [Gloeothece verrucosa]ADN15056.1 prolipoprotein diacylglyceryl transferase [Gloeothece verrucosa PCC 7822]
MQFPVYLEIGNVKLHPHLVFELIAYIVSFRLLFYHNLQNDVIPLKERSFIAIGAMFGALIGTKILVVFQYLDVYLQNPEKLQLLFVSPGKTLVGSLLGGLIGVELTKKILAVKCSTGDAFVYPLIVGMTIGRIGCFLTGLEDGTYGLPTNLPWGIDFGDGILRHPTQLYEIAFLIVLMVFLFVRQQYKIRQGDRFNFFMISYLGFRLFIDFIKPTFLSVLGLSSIQIACLLGLIYYFRSMPRLFEFHQHETILKKS